MNEELEACGDPETSGNVHVRGSPSNCGTSASQMNQICSENTIDEQEILPLHDIVLEKLKDQWKIEQEAMKAQHILTDVERWQRNYLYVDDITETCQPADKNVPCVNNSSCVCLDSSRPLEFIGGVDISFIKGDDVNACAAFVVLKLPHLDVVYEDLQMVKMTAPYIPGFLAFREVDPFVTAFKRLKETKPECTPQVIICDGNGYLHPNRFGFACHLGVLLDIPTIGVAKNLHEIDGIVRDERFQQQVSEMTLTSSFPLVTESGEKLGTALLTGKNCSKPVFVSVGHKISLDTAVWAVMLCSDFRVPEPTRQADIRSREFLRKNFPNEAQIKTTGKHSSSAKSHPPLEEADNQGKEQDLQNISNDSLSEDTKSEMEQ